MADWQPIATAPKDGSEVDLWTTDNERTIDAVWNVKRKRWEHWGTDWCENRAMVEVQPAATHWRFPPTAPDTRLSNGVEAGLEAACRAHCDYFGGEGHWDTGLLKTTRPDAFKAMRLAFDAARAWASAQTDTADIITRLEAGVRYAGENELGIETYNIDDAEGVMSEAAELLLATRTPKPEGEA